MKTKATKVKKVKCTCAGGRLIDPRDPTLTNPLTPIAVAWLAGYEAAAKAGKVGETVAFHRGLNARIGTVRPDGMVLTGFCWGHSAETLKHLARPAKTVGEIGRDNWPAIWKSQSKIATSAELVNCAFGQLPDGNERRDEKY